MSENSPFLSVRDVARLMNLSTGRIYQLLAAGEIPVSKIGGSYRVPAEAWNAWLSHKAAESLAAQQASSR